ncbi:MAG: archaetidylserine decarboxylase [Polyangia bacterium]
MSRKLPVSDRLASELLHWFPKQVFSRGMGWASKLMVPRPLRDPIYRGFAWRFGVDLSELDRPLAEFPRFDEFFCRPLPEGARSISAEERALISPCDGVLSGYGRTEPGGNCIHAKGQEYTVAGLLNDQAMAQRFVGGTFATIYLAPHNYHRVHSPLAGQVIGYRHIPGARFPVNALSVRTIPRLFMRNERLVTYLRTSCGDVALVMVAATGVGNITVSYEPSLATPAGGPDRGACTYDKGQEKPLGKGEELGMFHLGSTVILLFEPGCAEIELPAGTVVRLGQKIGQINPRDSHPEGGAL